MLAQLWRQNLTAASAQPRQPAACGWAALSHQRTAVLQLHRTQSGAHGHGRQPAGYRWSSYAANALGQHDPLITPHERYLALGPDGASRQIAYRAVVADAIPAEELALIRLRLQCQHALGSDRSGQ